MRAKLANLHHCAVPFLSRAAVNLCWHYNTYNFRSYPYFSCLVCHKSATRTDTTAYPDRNNSTPGQTQQHTRRDTTAHPDRHNSTSGQTQKHTTTYKHIQYTRTGIRTNSRTRASTYSYAQKHTHTTTCTVIHIYMYNVYCSVHTIYSRHKYTCRAKLRRI